MNAVTQLFTLLVFPGGFAVLAYGLVLDWARRKLSARLQSRIGPPWYQPWADTLKLCFKVEMPSAGVDDFLFTAAPLIALAGSLTAALYVPLFGVAPIAGFAGDLVVVVYLLSLLTVGHGLAGANTPDRFSLVGATRALTQLFAYEAPFLLALLGPALAAGSWQIAEVAEYARTHWLVLTQPLGFAIAVLGLMGKLEMPPFDAPEAETEIVAGALTEYSGRRLAFFRLARQIVLVVGLALIAAFYLGDVTNVFAFVFKTLSVLALMTVMQTLFTRLRIDQTVAGWWRGGVILALGQLFFTLWRSA